MEDVLTVTYHKNNDVYACLLVSKRIDGCLNIINIFYGKEAEQMYKTLTDININKEGDFNG